MRSPAREPGIHVDSPRLEFLWSLLKLTCLVLCLPLLSDYSGHATALRGIPVSGPASCPECRKRVDWLLMPPVRVAAATATGGPRSRRRQAGPGGRLGRGGPGRRAGGSGWLWTAGSGRSAPLGGCDRGAKCAAAVRRSASGCGVKGPLGVGEVPRDAGRSAPGCGTASPLPGERLCACIHKRRKVGDGHKPAGLPGKTTIDSG